MRIQVLEIAIKLGGTGFEAIGDYPLQAKRIPSEARDSTQLSLERTLSYQDPHVKCGLQS
jgi:hypothetical protein